MKRSIPELVTDFHSRTAGTRIRGQTVESVEVIIDTNGENGSLRHFLHVFFVEPAGFAKLPEAQRLMRRVFWDTDFAYMAVGQDELIHILDGSMQVPESRWLLSDEQRFGDDE